MTLNCLLLQHSRQVLEALFIFCVVWSIGAALVQHLDIKDRDRFDAFIKTNAGMGTVESERLPPSQLPARSLFEYCFDTGEGAWRSWKSYVAPYCPPADGQFAKILVPTVDVVRWVGQSARRLATAILCSSCVNAVHGATISLKLCFKLEIQRSVELSSTAQLVVYM